MPPFPEGSRVVHIGPHKTGTTAVQAALWNLRPALLAQGVRHVGRSRNPTAAAQSVVGRPSAYTVDKPPPISNWDGLVGEIRRATEPRVVVSSEFFAWADPDAIRRVADDLDPARIQVVVTVRALTRVMPSMWQQDIQQGRTFPWEEWVRGTLAEPHRAFWRLERHDELIQRWAGVVGRDRVTAIVVDDRDHGVIMRGFEALLGLSTGTLADQKDQTNRSLTFPEAEAVRAFNVAFQAEKLPKDLHARTMRFGAAQVLKRRVPPAGERRIALPGWARDPVVEIQGRIVDGIRESGVRVIGDLEALRARSEADTDDAEVAIPADVVAALGMGLIESTGAIRSAGVSKGPFRFAEPAEVLRVPTYQLLGTVAGRAWRKAFGWIPIPRRGKRGG